MKTANFIKVSIPAGEYAQITEKADDRKVVRLLPEEMPDGTVECWEATVRSDADIEALKADIEVYVARREQSERLRQDKARLKEIEQELNATDYIVIKKAEGINITVYDSKYGGDFLAYRARLREEYNSIEERLEGNV